MNSEERILLRTKLIDAAKEFVPSVQLRKLEDFHELDEGLLYASNNLKDAVVLLCEDVDWGPELSSYVEPIDEFRAKPELVIGVPNTIVNRIEEVMQCLATWFDC